MIKVCLACNRKFKIYKGNYKFCPECRPLIRLSYGFLNRPQIDAKHYRLHKKEINNRRNIYFKNRKKIDISFKLKCNLRSQIWDSLKRRKKSIHMIELLGCSIEQLKSHLEKQFTKGMSWSNYGKWHIDHIRPCASFDLSLPEHQKACFHYTNLQPLWAIDNLIKGAKT